MPPLGEHWEISPDEAKKLSIAQKKAFRHIAPSVSETFADWFMLAQVSAGIIGPRTLQTVLIRREARATRPAPAAATAPPLAAGAATSGASSPGSSAPQVVPPQPTATMPKGPRTPAELDPDASLIAQVTAGSA